MVQPTRHGIGVLEDGDDEIYGKDSIANYDIAISHKPRERPRMYVHF